MKIIDKHHPLYIKACRREAQFWEGADDYAEVEVPARVISYENEKRTGDKNTDEITYLQSLGHFPKGLSLGSGGGSYELQLLEAGIVDHFVFVDISEKALDTLRSNAAKRGLTDKIETRVQDFNFLELPENEYDFVSCQNMLHHIVNLEESLYAINQSLTDKGVFVINECIGESKMYWSDVKMSFINTVQSVLSRHGISSKVFFRTNPKVLTNNCPFECVRSSELYSIVDHYFGKNAIRHIAYGPIRAHRNAISDDKSDLFFDIIESFDEFAMHNQYVQPNRLYGIYKKTDITILSSTPRSEKELQENIGVTPVNERSLMKRSEKIQKRFPRIYNILKRLYFTVR